MTSGRYGRRPAGDLIFSSRIVGTIMNSNTTNTNAQGKELNTNQPRFTSGDVSAPATQSSENRAVAGPVQSRASIKIHAQGKELNTNKPRFTPSDVSATSSHSI
jgi:hypothetical protein